jgi:hypothetical protein
VCGWVCVCERVSVCVRSFVSVGEGVMECVNMNPLLLVLSRDFLHDRLTYTALPP